MSEEQDLQLIFEIEPFQENDTQEHLEIFEQKQTSFDLNFDFNQFLKDEHQISQTETVNFEFLQPNDHHQDQILPNEEHGSLELLNFVQTETFNLEQEPTRTSLCFTDPKVPQIIKKPQKMKKILNKTTTPKPTSILTRYVRCKVNHQHQDLQDSNSKLHFCCKDCEKQGKVRTEVEYSCAFCFHVNQTHSWMKKGELGDHEHKCQHFKNNFKNCLKARFVKHILPYHFAQSLNCAESFGIIRFYK